MIKLNKFRSLPFHRNFRILPETLIHSPFCFAIPIGNFHQVGNFLQQRRNFLERNIEQDHPL